jgi:mono/diheme cytochrome c family protein
MRERGGGHRAMRKLALLVLAAVCVACGDDTGEPVVAAKRGGSPGEILYLTYCQSCHGIGGRGDGPVAGSLRVTPADLTTLWEAYGTPLDRERVAAYIDGRRLFEAHGPREMPIWGDEFFEDVPPNTHDLDPLKRRLVDVLVRYLETLQTERRT